MTWGFSSAKHLSQSTDNLLTLEAVCELVVVDEAGGADEIGADDDALPDEPQPYKEKTDKAQINKI
jgi:hypothetical protein